jgi:hypothetical protein
MTQTRLARSPHRAAQQAAVIAAVRAALESSVADCADNDDPHTWTVTGTP